MAETLSGIQAARAAYESGDLGAAAAAYRDVLSSTTQNHDEAYQVLGTIALISGKIELSIQLNDAALALNPALAVAHVNRAVALRQLGRKGEARAAAEQAVQSDPLLADAWHTASFLALEARAYDKAFLWAQAAVQIAPQTAQFQCNYANLLMIKGDLRAAYEAAAQAVSLSPDEASVHQTVGQILRAAGHPERAARHFKRAIALKPDYTDAYSALASSLSVMGMWDQAWPVWEHRPYDQERFAALPRWDGKQSVGHLIVHAEQGMGDALNFMRYVPLIRERATRLTLQVPLPLQKIVRACFPEMMVITPHDILPEADAHMPMMSLPYVLNTRLNSIPPVVPLKISEEKRAVWRAYLAPLQKPRIGLVWAGNPDHTNDHNRSLPFAFLKPLLADFAPHLISLQDGKVRRLSAYGVIDQPDEKLQEALQAVGDDAMEATAALMQELDLVITIDTLPAHMAGTLSCPTWLLLPFDPDWRWLYGREDTPWYPTLRIFRQRAPRDWVNVVANVSAELHKLAAGDVSVLAAKIYNGPPLAIHPHAINLPEKD